MVFALYEIQGKLSFNNLGKIIPKDRLNYNQSFEFSADGSVNARL